MSKKISKLKLTLQNRAKSGSAPTKKQFQTWAEAALVSTAITPEITIRIVSRSESATLNQTFRHKPGATNVLSFPYAPIPGEDAAPLGDLVICAELVKQEAEAEHKPVEAHWAHLTVHGLLHLQGYDHLETQDTLIMERLETQILQELGFPDPYQLK